LSDAAKSALSHYVRQDRLVVTAIATFDQQTGRAPVEQKGERMVFSKFKPWFEDEKNKVLVGPLKERFREVIEGLSDFPDVGKNPSKSVMLDSLRKYEEERPNICTQERSNDLFYGSTRGKGMLEPFIQWIYVPAVKDASEEGVEAGNTALGKLLQRTVRQKVNFDADLAAISEKARQEYDALLEKEQGTLESLSTSLGKRLEVFAHPGAGLAVEWLQGSEKSVRIDGPKATIKATEGPFKGSLVRFGHGLQRSFLLVILQELASLEQQADGSDKPTLVLGIEEPELYQHPPQARHLSTELRALADAGSQILLTTHSPYFVSGEAFDEIRLVRKKDGSGASYMTRTDFPRFAKRMANATGKAPDKPTVARAKLLAALRPEPSELYFCQRLILVEGLEDRAYVTAALHLEDQWHTVRRSGLHMISCDRKSNVLQLLCIAQELKIPCFVIFDADGDETNVDRRKQHERDNASLLKALALTESPFPTGIVCNAGCAIWPDNLEAAIRASFSDGDWQALLNKARNAIDPNASLKKNPVLIAEATV
jgi:putative ATP-dependent endonuclease of the OLD family